RRTLSRFCSEQFVLLCVHSVACPARDWRIGGACLCNQQSASRRAENEHAQRRIAGLAFHGFAVALSLVHSQVEDLACDIYTKLEAPMETVIGVFSSRERAEEAVAELLRARVPEQAIVFLTRSETEA